MTLTKRLVKVLVQTNMTYGQMICVESWCKKHDKMKELVEQLEQYNPQDLAEMTIKEIHPIMRKIGNY